MTSSNWAGRLPGLVFLLGWLLGNAAVAAEYTPEPSRHDGSADIVVMNRRVATLRGTFLGTSPAGRAKKAEANLEEILARGGPGEVTVKSEPQGNVILIDNEAIMILVSEDVTPIKGEDLKTLTNNVVTQFKRVIADTQESRNLHSLLRNSGYALAGFLTYLILLKLARRLRALANEYLLKLVKGNVQRLQFIGSDIAHDRLIALAHSLVVGLFWLATVLLSYQWLSFTFRQFPYTRPWGEHLSDFFIGIFVQLGSGILHAIPDLIVALLIFLLARSVIGVLRPFFDRVESGLTEVGWVDHETVKPTRRIVSLLIWLFAIVMAYPYLPGAQSDAFKGMSVLIGLMVSLGASSIVGQGASGLILMYTRTLRSGEYVRVGDHEGTVTELGLFATRIRTGIGEELSLPNSVILGTVTKNFSRSSPIKNGMVVHTTVTIGYDTPWRQVEAMLVEAALRTPGIAAQPEPHVLQTALSDFYPEYRIVCHAVPSPQLPRAKIMTTLHANIQDVFNQYGVQIMSPHYERDPEHAKRVAPSDWYPSPAKPPEAHPSVDGQG